MVFSVCTLTPLIQSWKDKEQTIFYIKNTYCPHLRYFQKLPFDISESMNYLFFIKVAIIKYNDVRKFKV